MGRAKNTPFFFLFVLFLFCVFFIIFVIFVIWIPVKGESRPPFTCDPADGGTQNLPFCRVSLHIRDRVLDLIGRLTLQEKVKLLANNAAPVDRLGIRGYEWWSEALHGVAKTGPGVKFGGDYPNATSFPQVITMAASYNASLWEAIGRVVSTEARAMYNGGVAGLTYWSPNVNIFRDPRWGRGQETPGEDPTLTAKYAASYVRGLQDNAQGNRLKVAACCKHYTAYDLDSWKGVDRYHFNAKVSQQDLEETYNVPFKSCVLEGKVASVMCSYNQVNGKPTCADPNLLLGTIRGQWKLNGYIVSDCDSVEILIKDQHYKNTPEDAVAAVIKAGLDLDCGPYLAAYTEGAIRQGKLTEADVDRSVSNLLTVQMRLGMFDGPKQAYLNLGPRDVCSPAHKQLALEAAQQGIVLLQNRDLALPLSTGHHRTVAVIGPHADATTVMIGNYAGEPCGYTTPLQGISRYAKTIHEVGCTAVACTSNRPFSRAKAAARQADATILVMGLNQGIEQESLDRVELLLPGYQQDLVSRVARASRGPVVLVLMSGGPIDVSFAKNDPKISAILWTGYPGQAGGAAIADVLYGMINPGGKLPMTWYPQDYLSLLPMTDMAMHADPSRGYPGRTYRFYRGPVVFPFGFGLSYTSFRLTLGDAPARIAVPLAASRNTTTVANDEVIRVADTNCMALTLDFHIDVENTGRMDGPETVVVYASYPADGAAEKRLVAFEKVHLPAGSKSRVQVKINACDHLSTVDRYGIRNIPMGEHNLHVGEDLQHTISIHGE